MVIPLPPNFHAEPVNVNDYKLVSITLGWSMGFAFLTGTKAGRQTYKIWRRTHSWNHWYIWLIWGELLVNVAFALYDYIMVMGIIPFGFEFCMIIVSLWVIQIQLLPQIILNRISMIAVDKRLVKKLKILVAILIGLINISVYCIWIPGHMEISKEFMRINNVWDRMEKALYAVIDFSLNFYFLYLVRKNLITGGLQKYNRLFYFNAAIVWVSMATDILIIGMMSLSNTLIYVQFHPIAYLAKLNIEMTMADLIGKVATSTQRARSGGPVWPHSGSSPADDRTWASGTGCPTCNSKPQHRAWVSYDMSKGDPSAQDSSNDSIDIENTENTSIKKTVSTSVSISRPWPAAEKA